MDTDPDGVDQVPGGAYLIEDIDPASHLTRETFAYFGRAFYMSQVVEHGLVNVIVLARIAASRAGNDTIVSDPWAPQFKKTFGDLLKRFTNLTGEEEDALQAQLAQSLADRNLLAHGYWRERAEDFMTQSGKMRMLDELDAINDRLSKVNDEVDRVAFKVGSALGITPEAVYAEVARMRAALNDSDNT